MTTADTIAFLRDVRLFKSHGDPELASLARNLRERTLKKGQVLFREGEKGDEMFIVRRGVLIISKAVTGHVEQVLTRVGVGEFFGEMSLFDRAPRSATVQADSDATMLALDRERLQELIDVNPRAGALLMHALVEVFIERLRASSDLVAEVTRWGLEATGLDIEPR
ncbi:MAG TPA: cyclic nucleotide-binding domain-containing protein [Methylomirabilota bacterium]|jgi:CRP/FNR family transcriptional regulator